MDWYESSTDIDKHFGFRVTEIETRLLEKARAMGPGGSHHTWGSLLHEGNQTWVGLHPETIQTPYSELLRMTEKLELCPGEKVVDLGAGYGRLGILLHHQYPRVKFLGIEYVPERVAEGQRIYQLQGMDPDTLTIGDLTAGDFFPEPADHYFIYDFGKVPHIRHLLQKLSRVADSRKFTVTGRGKGIRSLISHEFPWLTSFYDEENFSIYRF
ncbi:MAG: class I SAM-dependent methyltransferase [Bdellovibrionota bacterium]